MTKNDVSKELCRVFFKDDYGNPLEITEGQAEIFSCIFFKQYPRVNIIASTQYGKSTIVACALILRSRVMQEEWAVIAGRADKAKIIMEKVIRHTFDNPLNVNALEIDRNEPLERIKRERSKERITWKGGGEIRIYSAQTRSVQNVNDSLTGFGSPNIVEDESALIPDPFQTMILRMLGGHKENTLIKIGNPFYRNHFFSSAHSDRYKHIFIDYKTALDEGRYTEEFINEARETMTAQEFSVLYECQFPAEDELDSGGYYHLVNETALFNAKVVGKHEGELRLGVDVGEGGDENVVVLRSATYAQIVHVSRIKDLMATTRVIIDLMEKYKVKPENTFVDATGIGAGVVARLKEIGKVVAGIKWAESSEDKTYANLKAENYMKVKDGIEHGLRLEPHDGWNELLHIKWKKNTSDKISIKTKEQMRKEGLKSPNVADALALSYNRTLEENAPRVWAL